MTRDLRLVPVAVGCWAVAWVATGAPARVGWCVAALLLAAALACGATLLSSWRATSLGSTSTGRCVRRSAKVPTPIVFAVLAVGIGASAAGAVRVATTGSGPLPELAASNRSAVVDLVVTSDPEAVRARAVGGTSTRRVRLDGRVERVEWGGRAVTTRSPVVMLADADRWSELLPGSRVRVRADVRPTDGGRHVAALLMADGPPDVLGDPPAGQRTAGSLRDGLRSSAAVLPDGPAGLLPALVVGDTSALPPGLVEDFRTTGLTHLTAVSGANVTIVAVAALVAARWLGARGRLVHALAALAVLGFVVLARPDPSVLRAAAMGLVGALALVRGGRRTALSALCAAVVVLVLADPFLSRSFGFVLSTLATLALVVVAPRWVDAMSAVMPARLAEVVAVPLAPQAVTAPVVVLLDPALSVVAVPANILVAPAVGPATLLGVLVVAIAPVVPVAGELVARAAGIPVGWIVTVAERGASLDGASVRWPAGTGGAVLLAVVTLAVVLAVRLGRRIAVPRPLRLGLVVVLVAALVGVPGRARAGWPPPGWVAVVCDVGQGDATVLNAGDGTGLLVDAGPDPVAVDRCLDDAGVDRLALVLLTHFHADHVDGLPGALRRPVGLVEVGVLDAPVEQVQQVADWTAEAGVSVRRAVVGRRAVIGDVTTEVLWPDRVVPSAGSPENNASVVIRATVDGIRILLTGDIEPEGQEALMRRTPVAADVVKMPHHGSRHFSARFPPAVGAAAAIASAGSDNTYSHPTPDALEAWARAGAQIFRTDQDGDVAVVSADGSVRVVARDR